MSANDSVIKIERFFLAMACDRKDENRESTIYLGILPDNSLQGAIFRMNTTRKDIIVTRKKNTYLNKTRMWINATRKRIKAT